MNDQILPRDLPATADLVDAYLPSGAVQGTSLHFELLGQRRRAAGPVRTLRVLEDNALVRATLEQPGDGHLLVVDGGASLHRALVGDLLAGFAVQNGWAGIIVLGAIRDAMAIDALDVHVKTLGRQPVKSRKEGVGLADVPVRLGEIWLRPGEWLYSDDDGLLHSERALDLERVG